MGFGDLVGAETVDQRTEHQSLAVCQPFEGGLGAEHASPLDPQLVEQDGVPVAGHVSSALGQSKVFLFGASTPEGNRHKASYLLQWDALTAARSRGMKWYDLGGIDPAENEGVYRFKARMSGIDVTAPGPFELLPNGVRAWVTRAAERVYRLLQLRKSGPHLRPPWCDRRRSRPARTW